LSIFENTQRSYFSGQEEALICGVSLADAKQDDQADGNLGNGLVIHAYLGSFDPLNKGAHGEKTIKQKAFS
jgi:hypothetical protein